MTDKLSEHIGLLFYAIAKADKTLSFNEYVRLSKTLEKNWQHIENCNIELIKHHFNKLQKDDITSSSCFDEFVVFLHKHPDLFTTEIKTLILKTANDIAYAFAKINKSELNYMARLSLEFKKMKS